QLLVKDEQTVVIGGLIDRQRERGRSGVPILKDIPVLGMLFGSTQHAEVQTELFVFLTPHIIEDDADADRLKGGVDSESELLKNLRLPGALLPSDTAPPPPHDSSG
ncbi:MAG: type II secretion system protein GspD, partial [Longimicrobiales bacterium]